MPSRIDRIVDVSLKELAYWLVQSGWRGKEHDCVNIFATKFLLPLTGVDSAIRDPSQIRIEGGVPQPSGYPKPSARKDLVIWRKPLDVAWNEQWQPVRCPWVVMEWKVYRLRQRHFQLDSKDVKWLLGFSRENPTAFGYAVAVDFSRVPCRLLVGKFRAGELVTEYEIQGGTVSCNC